jgi:hypothetical protein
VQCVHFQKAQACGITLWSTEKLHPRLRAVFKRRYAKINLGHYLYIVLSIPPHVMGPCSVADCESLKPVLTSPGTVKMANEQHYNKAKNPPIGINA